MLGWARIKSPIKKDSIDDHFNLALNWIFIEIQQQHFVYLFDQLITSNYYVVLGVSCQPRDMAQVRYSDAELSRMISIYFN